MKASELRIGNHVGVNLKELPENYFTMVEVSEHACVCTDGLEWHPLRDRQFFEAADLEPIPLTEEWLKKFGFIHHGADGYSCDEKSTLRFYFSTRNGLMCNVFYRRTTPSDNVKGCFYVHEFQNLFFALTGQEL